MSRRSSGEPSSYSQFACIGAGVSGIALGATLKRWYGITDIEFFDRNEQLGGTWITNQYPGAFASLWRPLITVLTHRCRLRLRCA
jgi:hypothetical protein